MPHASRLIRSEHIVYKELSMSVPGTTEEIDDSHGSQSAIIPKRWHLERHSWRNWFLLVGVLVITMMGLVITLPPLLNQYTSFQWPWLNTDLLLLLAFSVLIFIFVAYLTHQQRKIVAMRTQMHELERSAHNRKRKTTVRLFTLFNVSRMMGAGAKLQSVFDCITQMSLESFNCDQASLMFLDDSKEHLVVRSASGHAHMGEILGTQQRIGKGISGWVAEHREALLLGRNDDMEKYTGLKCKLDNVRSAMVVPIITGDELIGILNVSTRSQATDFDKEDLHTLRAYAESAGACIRHAGKAEQMNRRIKEQEKQIENLQSRLTERLKS